MPGAVKTVETIEELYQFLNEKGVLEIAIRGKNNKFKAFQKVAINNLKQTDSLAKANEAVNLLVKSNQINLKSLNMLSDISKISQITMVLSGINLFATVAGFAVMNAKINKVSAKIDEAIKVYKDTSDVNTEFKVNDVISDYSNMMDCRKKQSYYSEEQMRKLVADEYNVLNMLTKIFYKDLSNNPEELMFSMLSLASMLSASLRFFDETYYFNNREKITGDEKWHNDHDKWTSLLETMVSKDFICKIQDYGFFDIGLNTTENDCFYKSYIDQILNLQQDIEDNQKMIIALDDPELFESVDSKLNEDARADIESALKEVGADPKMYEKSMRLATA